MALDDIKNFVRIDDRLGTGGQPTELQLQELAENGCQVVINLGLLDPKYCLPDEAGLVARLGMSYRHIPVVFTEPRVTELEAFVAAMDANASAHTFVHCALNWRVSSFVALYGQLRLGWSPEEADSHARKLWQPNETWQRFMAEGRQRWGLVEPTTPLV
jgi:protein tyrosine phosphatase (PTP) superfamily phosphohydrolase (DUF442 family)